MIASRVDDRLTPTFAGPTFRDNILFVLLPAGMEAQCRSSSCARSARIVCPAARDYPSGWRAATRPSGRDGVDLEHLSQYPREMREDLRRPFELVFREGPRQASPTPSASEPRVFRTPGEFSPEEQGKRGGPVQRNTEQEGL